MATFLENSLEICNHHFYAYGRFYTGSYVEHALKIPISVLQKYRIYFKLFSVFRLFSGMRKSLPQNDWAGKQKYNERDSFGLDVRPKAGPNEIKNVYS